ncbi:MAG: hypothetical protein GOVbin630_41 [Prokaryotic dsDNA virus sp.]|nr:MAG: hypothetical protein GOVbin630_41 [Prokaryotic dsDNA virus sp.]|tara:strand:- start:32892 stop:33449 length:558 start_codon:yes stop_codon:yes gene_type:complete
MAFWTSNQVEPKRAFRFLMDIVPVNELNTISSWFIKTAKKPTFQMDGQGEVKYIQHTFKYPGRITWQPIDVTLVDPATPDASAILMNILRASGYTAPTTPNAAKLSISKFTANQAMGSIYLRQIDARGKVIEEWKLWNPFITQVDFGQLGYDSDDLVEYTLSLDYDYATLKTFPQEVNANVTHNE